MKHGKGFKRALLSLATLLLVLVALFTATFFFWLGPTVKILAEKIGSKALGAPISMERLSINPRQGTLILAGFEIGNHETFGYSNTVSLAEVSIAIDIETLFSDTLIIHEILISSPYFVYEQNSATDNITEYITNLFAFANIDPNQPKKPKPEKEGDDKAPKEILVNQLRITDVKMFLANTADPDLDVNLAVEELTLSMSNGVVHLKNMTLSHPGLLSTPHIFTLESLALKLNPESIYSDAIVIEKVEITKPYAYYEQNSETDTLAEFLKISKSFTSKPSKKTTPLIEESPRAAEPGPTIELHEFIINDTQLHIVNITKPELNIRLRLEKFTSNPLSGDVQFSNLSLSNPKLLATPNVFELEAIKIKIDPATLALPTVAIQDIQVIKPYVFLEQNLQTDTVTEFMRIAKRIATDTHKKTSAKSAQPKPEKEAVLVISEPTPPPFELHNLFIDDIQLKLLDTTHTHAPVGLQTMASIGNISVKLIEGALRIEAIPIPNPAGGFTPPHLFNLPHIDITIDPASVFSDQTVIKEIYINSPLINLEQTNTTGNVTELQKIIAGFTPSSTEPAPIITAEKPQPPVLLAEPPILLNSLVITNFSVTMTSPIPTNETFLAKRTFRLKNRLGANRENQAPPTEEFFTLAAIEHLSVEPPKGLLQIDSLNIGNPPGFANDSLTAVKKITVKIDPDSMSTDTLLIEDILIENPQITYERQLATDNIKALQAFIESATQKRKKSLSEEKEDEVISTTNPPPSIADTSTTNAPTGQKIIISHLLVKDGMVKAKISALPTAPIPLPNIEMTDIGKEKGGASISETSAKLYGAFYDAIIGSVSSVTGFAGDLLKGAGSLTLDTFGAVSSGASSRLRNDQNLDAEPEKKEKQKKKRSRRSGPRRRFL